MLNYGQVGINDLPDIWKVVEPQIQAAITRSQYQPELSGVLEEIKEGYQQLWVAYTNDRKIYGCCTTRVRVDDDVTYLEIVYVSGQYFEAWGPGLLQTLKHFALVNGCKFINADGRRGWMKHYKSFGFNELYTRFQLKLDDIVRH